MQVELQHIFSFEIKGPTDLEKVKTITFFQKGVSKVDVLFFIEPSNEEKVTHLGADLCHYMRPDLEKKNFSLINHLKKVKAKYELQIQD